MPKYNRIAAGIMALLMLFIMLFSVFYIAAESDHDCTGEDCPICACIGQCENTLHQIGDVIASCAVVILPIIYMHVSICLFAVIFPQETLVSIKVRLNN